jgi:hypothetical protein
MRVTSARIIDGDGTDSIERRQLHRTERLNAGYAIDRAGRRRNGARRDIRWV